MRRPRTLLLLSAVTVLATAGIVTGAAAKRPSAAAAATTTTTTKPAVTAPPVQGETLPNLDINLDTVLGGGKTATELKEPFGTCTQTSLIHVGQIVVFRMWGVDVKAGGIALTEANVAEGDAYLTIQGVKVGSETTTLRAPFAWGEHGKSESGPEASVKHSYWEVPIPTRGKTSGADIGWKTESSSGALAEIKEGTEIEIPPTSPAPLQFAVHVTTKPLTVTKTVIERVKVKGKHRKHKTKTVSRHIEVKEPSLSGEASWTNFALASQLVIAP